MREIENRFFDRRWLIVMMKRCGWLNVAVHWFIEQSFGVGNQQHARLHEDFPNTMTSQTS
jgi:hypothetical protein